MTTTSPALDSEPLVARIIAELQADPAAQVLLLRALLTNEFLSMPIRLERVEADVAELKIDVGGLKGDMLEVKLHRRVRSLLSRRLDLRRGQVVHSPLQDTHAALFLPVEKAFDAGIIDDAQETRIDATDIIIRAQRKADRTPVWVAVEVSNTIGQRDVERARQAADALSVVFSQDVLAVVVGYRIAPQDQQRGDEAEVHIFLIEENG